VLSGFGFGFWFDNIPIRAIARCKIDIAVWLNILLAVTQSSAKNRPLAKIAGTGKMPIPQEVFSLVGWASCPSENLIKKTFARTLI